MILSRIDSGIAAKIVALVPAQQRNALLIRMLGIKKVADDALRAVERDSGGPACKIVVWVSRRHRRHPEPARQDAIRRRC